MSSSVSRILGIGTLLSLWSRRVRRRRRVESSMICPLNVDYSTLRVADVARSSSAVREQRRAAPAAVEERLRLLTLASPVPDASWRRPPGRAGGQGPFSGTTVQVEGVDEADAVRYDGHYIYSVRQQIEGACSIVPAPTRYRNVIAIARTDATAATVQPITEFRARRRAERNSAALSVSRAPRARRVPRGRGESGHQRVVLTAGVAHHVPGWCSRIARPCSCSTCAIR